MMEFDENLYYMDYNVDTLDDENGSDYNSQSDSEREDIEFSLYSQIHYQDNERAENPMFSSIEIHPSADKPPVPVELDNCGVPAAKEEGKAVSEIDTIGSSAELSDEDSFVEEFSTDSEGTDRPSKLDAERTLYDIQMNVDYSEPENQEHEEVDQGKWSVNEQDRFGTAYKSFSSPRYYAPHTPLNVRCHNCNEKGHLSRVCPKPQKHLICHLCGATGHNSRDCPKSICFNCYRPEGHCAHECPMPRRRLYDDCRRCYMHGHRQIVCPDLWRQYHITTTEGKLVKVREKRNRKIYCHNCGDQGHFGFECEKDTINKYSPASYPFIAKYDQTYRTKRGRVKEYGSCDGVDPEEPSTKKFNFEHNKTNNGELAAFLAQNSVCRPIIVNPKHKEKIKGNKKKDWKKTKYSDANYLQLEDTNLWNARTTKTKRKKQKKKKRKKGKNSETGNNSSAQFNYMNNDTVRSVTAKKGKKNKGKNSWKTADHQDAQKKNRTWKSKEQPQIGRRVTQSKRGFTVSLSCLNKR